MTRHKILTSLAIACAAALPALSMADPRDPLETPHREMADHADPRIDHHADHHDWKRGERLPTTYRDHSYEVTDWQSHHLRQPPRGYHWVNVDGQFVLAAIATGLVADVLLNQ